MSGSFKVKKRQSARPPQFLSVLKSVLITSGSLLNTHDVERYLKSKNRFPSGDGAAERVTMLECFAYVVQFPNHADAASAICRQNHAGRLNPVCSFLYDSQSRSVYSGHQTLNPSQTVDPSQTDPQDADAAQAYDSQEPATILVTGLYFDHVTAESIKVCFEELVGGCSVSPVRSVQFLKCTGIAFVQFDRADDALRVVLGEEVRLKTFYGVRTVSVFLVRPLPAYYIHVTPMEDNSTTDDIPQGSNAMQTSSLPWQQNQLTGGLTDDVKDALRRLPSGKYTSGPSNSCKSCVTESTDVTRAILSLMSPDADQFPAVTLYTTLVAGYNTASGFENSYGPYQVTAGSEWTRESVRSATDPLGACFTPIPDASTPSPDEICCPDKHGALTVESDTTESDEPPDVSPSSRLVEIPPVFSLDASVECPAALLRGIPDSFTQVAPELPAEPACEIQDLSFPDVPDGATVSPSTAAHVKADPASSRDALLEEFAGSITSSTGSGTLNTSASPSADTYKGTPEILNSDMSCEVPGILPPASPEVASSTPVMTGEKSMMSADQEEHDTANPLVHAGAGTVYGTDACVHKRVNPLLHAATGTVNCGCVYTTVNDNRINQSPDEQDSDTEQDVFYDCVEEMDSALSRETGNKSLHASWETARHSVQDLDIDASRKRNSHFLQDTNTHGSKETNGHSLHDTGRYSTQNVRRYSTSDTDAQVMNSRSSHYLNFNASQQTDSLTCKSENEVCLRISPQTASLTIAESLQPDHVSTAEGSSLDNHASAIERWHGASSDSDIQNSQRTIQRSNDSGIQNSQRTIQRSNDSDIQNSQRTIQRSNESHIQNSQRIIQRSNESHTQNSQRTIQRPWETEFQHMRGCLRTELAQLKACMHSEISQLKTSVQSALAKPQSKLNSEIIQVKAQMATDIARLRARMQSGVADLQSSLQAQLNSCMTAAAKTQWSLQMQDRMQNRMLYEALQQTRAEIVTLKGETQDLKMAMERMQRQMNERDEGGVPNLSVINPSDTESIASMSPSTTTTYKAP